MTTTPGSRNTTHTPPYTPRATQPDDNPIERSWRETTLRRSETRQRIARTLAGAAWLDRVDRLERTYHVTED